VSPFRAASELLGDPQAILTALAQSSPDALICTDLEGRVIAWTQRAQQLFGYSADEMLGQRAAILIPADGREQERAMLNQRLRAGESIDPYVARLVRKDGQLIDVESTITPVRGRNQEIAAFLSISRDVTARMRAEAELRRSNEELEQFAYAASHDLSEPLRVIAGFVELLGERYGERLDEEARRFIDFTIGGVERMQAVIDDLLAYSRAGRVELALCAVDVGALIREVADSLFAIITESAATLETGELPVITAEPTLLRQVFQNLIGNAIKFCEQGPPRVSVTSQREGAAWRFDVIDNGPGIDPAHAEQVFMMFRRLHGREVPGTGIGLAIVKRIVERHGGRIRCEPAPGGGTRFSFTIPDEVAAAAGGRPPLAGADAATFAAALAGAAGNGRERR